MTYALVLGAGGVTGIAWETGLLQGLLDAGLDLTGADVIVGTSAGSVVGAQIATGCSLQDLYERQVTDQPGRRERPPDLGPLLEFFGARPGVDGAPATRPRPTPEVLAWIGGQARAASTKMSEASRLHAIKGRLPVHEWPERRLLITAIDTGSGSLAVWERSSAVSLPLAVASSCAVPWIYPPVTIHGRRYMDGGMRSVTNADLAAGSELVVVVAPSTITLDEEVAQLQADGARIAVLAPDEAALEAIGPNPLDPERRRAAAEAGLAQAPAAAELLHGLRELLTPP
ncbi:MAG TPA: patatin-like phospholipase family protein [Candidatus Dormibacteraeota bacterium]|nr:patatin-like phospholipase family protein [Candidatus Dormibacteraeota bacterium]